jgi:nitrite reductase (NADH) small subunit
VTDFITVAKVHEVPPGICKTVEVQGVFIALCNVQGTVYALDNTCPHAGGPLGEGSLRGTFIVCPWHGWRFNVRTGERPENPDLKVAQCSVRIEGEDIQVAIPSDF